MPKSKSPRKKRGKSPARKTARNQPKSIADRVAAERFLAAAAGLIQDLDMVVSDDLDEAQELIYDAWEADSDSQKIALAEKALEISPLCADAFTLLAQCEAPGSDKMLELCRSAVQAGELALGEDMFDEMAGEFWGPLETRPYMRARCFLAQVLWERGDHEESIEHYLAMLSLNPDDNQGIRYLLAACLLDLERYDDLATLLEEYDGDIAAAWIYTQALMAFRHVGDNAISQTVLAGGVKWNEHVPSYLLGRRKVPDLTPAYIAMGGEDEAACYARDFATGWAKVPGAMDWLERRHSHHTR